MTIPMFVPFMSDAAIDNAELALTQRMIGEGETVKRFEEALMRKFGFKNALLLNNGTAGLRLALAVSGVGPGDEVITTAMTCTATNMPILEQYAKPVFADVQFGTGNIDPGDIEHRITEKTRAIMCVHWGGYPCDMDEIHEIASRYDLPVIEDAAHALGAEYHGRPVGAISRFTMFSFQAIKHLTTIDGGLLTTLDKRDYEEAKVRRWFGIDRDKREPSKEWPGYSQWEQSLLGYKYQPNNVQAAIGLGNLQHFDEVLSKRLYLASIYYLGLKNIPGLRFLDYDSYARESAYWLFTIHVENRWAFYEMMKAKGIETSVCHIRNDLHPVFGGRRDDLPNLDRFEKSYICIPIHPAVSFEEVDYIVDAIRGGW